MQEDGSYIGRVAIYQDSVGAILTNPLGSGLGSTGLSGRVNTGGTGTQSVIADAGYAELVIQFGWLGAPLIIYALWRMWQEMAIRYRVGYRPSELMLARAFMISLVPACFVSNIITQFSLLWIVFGAALDPKAFRRFVAKLKMLSETAGLGSSKVRRLPVKVPPRVLNTEADKRFR